MERGRETGDLTTANTTTTADTAETTNMGGQRTSGTLTGTGEMMEMMTAASSLTMKFCFRDRSPRDRKNWDYKDKIRDKDVSNSYRRPLLQTFSR